jgi:hypothetical protein
MPRDRAACGVSAHSGDARFCNPIPRVKLQPLFLLFRSFPLFDRAAGFPSPRPQDAEAGARRACQGWPLFGGHPQGSALTRPSTTARWFDRGLTSLRLIHCPVGAMWSDERQKGVGGPGLRTFGPQSGRALSRGKDAARPSRLRRLGPSGNGPFRGRSRLAMPIIISGVRAVRSSKAACTRARSLKRDRIGLTNGGVSLTADAIVQGSPHARGRIRSQGASRTDRSGKGPAWR